MRKTRRFMLCDLETTNASPLNAEILEAYFGLYNGMKLEKELHLKIRPRYWDSAADEASKIHGITKDQARTFMPWREGMNQIKAFFPEDPVHFVCHANRRMFGRSGCYDWIVLSSQFLNLSFESYLQFGRVYPARKIITTHSLAKRFLNSQTVENNELGTICEALGIKIKKKHSAKDDAEACWQIFKKYRSQIDIDEFCENDYDYQPTTQEEIKSKKRVQNANLIDTNDFFYQRQEGEFSHE